MPMTKVRSKWVGGDLIFHDKTDESSTGYVLRIAENEIQVYTATTINGATKIYFGDTNHWIARDVGATLSANALVYFHVKILGNAEFIFTKDTLEMNANTITECGHIYFNNGALLEQSANKLKIYGGYQAGDVLELIGSTSTSIPRVVITDGHRVDVYGNLAVLTGTFSVGGASTFNNDVALNDNVLVASAKKISFLDTNSFIAKGLVTHMEITTDGELVITASKIYLNNHTRLFHTTSAGDEDGHMWYDPTADQFKGRANGATVSFNVT